MLNVADMREMDCLGRVETNLTEHRIYLLNDQVHLII